MIVIIFIMSSDLQHLINENHFYAMYGIKRFIQERHNLRRISFAAL
jgi:hypothetical protein